MIIVYGLIANVYYRKVSNTTLVLILTYRQFNEHFF